jgi:hypothetical protein
VRRLNLGSRQEWIACVHREKPGRPALPPDIPARPQIAYRKKGWEDWDLWLAAPRTFPAAHAVAVKLKFQTKGDWTAWCAGRKPACPPRPLWMPRHPDVVFASAWRGWDFWLGVPDPWRPHDAAAAWVRRLRLTSWRGWRQYVTGGRRDLPALPADIPRAPHESYARRGWRSYAHFLAGKEQGGKVGGFPPYAEAAAFVKRLKLVTNREWRDYVAGQMPDLPALPRGVVPKSPASVYRGKGWTGWPAWLGQD